MSEQNIVIEELTLIPIGDSKEIGIKPLRITVDGKSEPLIWDAREIRAIKEAVEREKS